MIEGLATLALVLGLAAGDGPGERIICVPSEDGKGWDCGRGADAPAPRALPREHNRPAPSAPPPYLMDPSRIPSVTGTMQYPASGPAPAAAAAPDSAPVPEPPAAPEPVVVPQPEPHPVAVAAPDPVPPPETASAPVPAQAPAPVLSPEPDPVQPPVVADGAADAGTRLLALPPGHFTVQLAGATRSEGFPALQRKLGITPDDCHVVRVRRNGGDWWLLLWRDFPDLASARAAAASLGSGYWPRRLAPLQAEVQAASAN